MLIKNWALHKIPEESGLKKEPTSDVLAGLLLIAFSRLIAAEGMPGAGGGRVRKRETVWVR